MKSLFNDWQYFMRENKDSKRVAKAVIYIGDEILLLLHERGWDLPGGHIKQEEDIVDGLIREVEEETGLQVTADKIKGPVYRASHMSVYEIRLQLGAVRLSDEHHDYKLIRPDDIGTFKMSDPFKRAIQKTFE
jgi:8-oxo-dGTP diphosphatase